MVKKIIKLLSIVLPLKSLFSHWNVSSPAQLWFVDRPIKQSENSKAALITVQKIEKSLNVKWTENILTNSFSAKKILSILEEDHQELAHLTNEEYLSCLKEMQENCVIRWLDDEVGWVLTLRPGKTLHQGFLCCYAGIATIHPLLQNSSYLKREYFFSICKTQKEDIVIDAKKYGNMSRFLPFLLEESDLDNFNINPVIRKKIAVANLQFKFARINQLAVPCIYVPHTITSPEDKELLLGINYSLQYLCKMYQGNKLFKFIDQETLKPIDTTFYSPKMIQINLAGISYSFSIPRFRIMAAKNLPQLKHTTVGFDEEKKEYYEISVDDDEIYAALMASPDAEIITVKPIVNNIVARTKRFLRVRE